MRGFKMVVLVLLVCLLSGILPVVPIAVPKAEAAQIVDLQISGNDIWLTAEMNRYHFQNNVLNLTSRVLIRQSHTFV